jgi:predicted site-specific integrase-resolvase
MRTRAAEEYTGFSRRTLHRWRVAGGLPWHLVEGSVVYHRDDIDRWMNKHRVAVYNRRHPR